MLELYAPQSTVEVFQNNTSVGFMFNELITETETIQHWALRQSYVPPPVGNLLIAMPSDSNRQYDSLESFVQAMQIWMKPGDKWIKARGLAFDHLPAEFLPSFPEPSPLDQQLDDGTYVAQQADASVVGFAYSQKKGPQQRYEFWAMLGSYVPLPSGRPLSVASAPKGYPDVGAFIQAMRQQQPPVTTFVMIAFNVYDQIPINNP